MKVFCPCPVGGEPLPIIIPGRRDHSVNGSWVDGWQYKAGPTGPIFRSQTNLNPAGGYFGGGVGNKGILGHFLPAPVPLLSLVSMAWTVTNLQPEGYPAPPTNGVPGIPLPYANIIVDLGVAVVPPFLPGGIVILVLGDELGLPILGSYSSPGPDQSRCVWTAAANRVLTVEGKGMAVFPDPPGPTIVASPEGTQPTAIAWQGFSRTIAAIVASYPGAMIINANPLDGGMPGPTGIGTIVSGELLIFGDSTTRRQAAVRLDEWKVNGIDV